MAKAIILYGPPGAGKNTQAELLAQRLELIHFETGPRIESLVHSPLADKDPEISRERDFFDSGILCTPEWVLKITKEATEKISKAGFGIVFSGSPRTEFEAFGDGKENGLIDFLEKIYTKENISVVMLEVPEEISIKRNTRRVVCSVCGLPILGASFIKECPFCGGPPRKRILDNVETLKVRLKEYRERTFPIVAELKKRGFRVIELDGTPAPYKVFYELEKALDIERKNKSGKV